LGESHAYGRGGPGLWLARATGADLIGIDWSPVGVESASAPSFSFRPGRPGALHGV